MTSLNAVTYTRLFNTIVRDVWNKSQGEAKRLTATLEAAVVQKRERLDRVDEALLHERSIDRQSYERQRDRFA
jgi:hypothetical protein